MRSVDVIVIGQGLAGTTLAWQLFRRRVRFVVVAPLEEGSSRIAAGLVTPVTGKRLAKSWRWDELFPAAVAFYRSVEAETGTLVFQRCPAVRLFRDEAERAEFHRRAGEMLAGLVRPNAAINPEWFSAPLGGFEMPAAARLDVPRYLDLSRQLLRREGAYLTADLDPAHDVEILADGVRLQRFESEARVLVLCSGFSPDSDPWFGGIRFNAAKGEILTLRVKGLAEDRVVHHGVWLASAG